MMQACTRALVRSALSRAPRATVYLSSIHQFSTLDLARVDMSRSQPARKAALIAITAHA